jgi:hypothetical protein
MKEYTLKDLAIDHDYYCSGSNFYSDEARMEFDTFSDFYEGFCEADIDMNLVFRWDLNQWEHSQRYWLELFMIHQRKGIFSPIHIKMIDEKDIPLFIKYITPHMEKLKSIWKPFDFSDKKPSKKRNPNRWNIVKL